MDDSLGPKAYCQLYGVDPAERIEIKYHGRLKGYNATVTKRGRVMTFRLSRKLETCEDEIKIGVIQELLNKIEKTKIETDETRMYHSFLRNMSQFAPVTDVDEVLLDSFSRINEMYFDGLMDIPNLVWGNENRRLMGTYTYATDTIMITSALEGAPEEVLDSVMYHEMLHKKHKFSCKNGRTHSHIPAFKRDEAKFYDKSAEKKLTCWLRSKHKRRKWFWEN